MARFIPFELHRDPLTELDHWMISEDLESLDTSDECLASVKEVHPKIVEYRQYSELEINTLPELVRFRRAL